jgi:two-component system chemotaxis sensor kinase CheA
MKKKEIVKTINELIETIEFGTELENVEIQNVLNEIKNKVEKKGFQNLSKTLEYLKGFLISYVNGDKTVEPIIKEIQEETVPLLNEFEQDKLETDEDLEFLLPKLEIMAEPVQEQKPELESNPPIRQSANSIIQESEDLSIEQEKDNNEQQEFDYSEVEDIVDDFSVEAEEILEVVEHNFINLKEADENVINELFRGMHTIKGAAGMINLNSAFELSHKMESLLDKIRNKEFEPSFDIEDVMLEGLDKLKEIISLVKERDNPEIYVGDTVEKIKNLLEGKKISSLKEEQKKDSKEKEQNVKPIPDNKINQQPKTKSVKPQTKSSQQQTLRIDIKKLDNIMDEMGELIIEKIKLEQNIHKFSDIVTDLRIKKNNIVRKKKQSELTKQDFLELYSVLESFKQIFIKIGENVNRTTMNMQNSIMQMRLVPLDTVFKRFPRLVRDISRKLRKKINFVIEGAETEIDKGVSEFLYDPLLHIIRNSLDHGIEYPAEREKQDKKPTGQLELKAYYKGDKVIIEIIDDGKGMDKDIIFEKALEKGIVKPEDENNLDDKEKLMLIFSPGFSTNEEVTELSGRGVGMDVVRNTIEKLKGTIDIETEPGQGTKLTISLPLTLAIVKILLFRCESDTLALPLYNIRETVYYKPDEIYESNNKPVINLRGTIIPIIYLSDVLDIDRDNKKIEKLPIIVTEVFDKVFGLVASELVEKREIVIKNLGEILKDVVFISGATILGDGEIILILDPVDVIKQSKKYMTKTYSENQYKNIELENQTKKTEKSEPEKPKILVAEDSAPILKFIENCLVNAGYDVTTVTNGEDGIKELKKQQYDLISTDIVMPGMDGYEFTQKVRKLKKYKLTPVIALSQQTERINRVKAFKAGIDEYLTKPVDTDIYLKTISKMLK